MTAANTRDTSNQQRLVLVVSILAAFVTFLDGSIVNVALPAIARSLGGGLSTQQWVVDGYLLTLSSLILLAGSLSDLLGRKRILVGGLIGFGVTSLLCALAPSPLLLIIFRLLQGMAGALLVPSSLALIMSSFSGRAQSKAIGTWTGWTGIAFIIGPLFGGTLVDLASWRWIFAVNIIPIIITLELLRRIADKPSKAHPRIDIVGAVLGAFGLAGPVFALIEQPKLGWGDPLVYGLLIAGFILLSAFIAYERRIDHAMLPPDIFKNRNFSIGNIATLAIYAALGVSTFIIVVFLQQVSGYSAVAAGLALLPVTIIMFFLSSRFGALAGRFGPRLFMGIGPLVAAVGFLLMLRVQAHSNYWAALFPAVVVFGLGLSMTVAPLTSAILGDVKTSEAGIASAVNNAISRVASLVAIAAIGAVLASQFSSSLSHYTSCFSASGSAIASAKKATLVTTPPKPFQNNLVFHEALEAASVSAFHTSLEAVAGLLIIGGIISLFGIQNPPAVVSDVGKTAPGQK